MEKYTDYIIDTVKRLLAIPSPTGFTHMAADFVKKELERMGYQPVLTRKGAVFCDLGVIRQIKKDQGQRSPETDECRWAEPQ